VYLLEAWMASTDWVTKGLMRHRACRFVACAAWMSADMARHLGVAPERIATIPDGVDLQPWVQPTTEPADRDRHRRALGLPEGVPLVGAIGRFARQKGIMDFVRSIPLIRETIPAARFALVGDGEDAGLIQAEASLPHIAPYLTVYGYRSDYRDFLRSMDVFVFPSHFEGLSLLLLEALASGTPVVATAITANLEAVTPDRHALVVPPADPPAIAQAVVALLNDPSRARELSSNARQRVSAEFSLDRMASDYAELYSSIVR